MKTIDRVGRDATVCNAMRQKLTDTTRLEIDGEYFGDGWLEAEHSNGHTERWSTGESCEIFLPVTGRIRAVNLVVAGWTKDCARNLEASIDGSSLKVRTFLNEHSAQAEIFIHIEMPSRMSVEPFCKILLSSIKSTIPSLEGWQDDNRSLGIRLKNLDIIY